MSPAAWSVFGFGIYMIGLGIVSFTVPNLILVPLGFPPTHQPWIRVGASLVAIVGGYYMVAAWYELTPFLWATVVGRVLEFVAFLILVRIGHFPRQLLLFVVPDEIGAAVTAWLLLR
jgi:hypothetical protein